jgi:tetratricopeptide (TPR) repeat protein
VDPRTDLYGLGCVMYEMLTGSPPFTGPTAQSILARHACDPVAPIRTVRSTVPPQVEAAIMQLLAKSPADRLPNTTALVEALERPAAKASPRRVRRGITAALAVVATAGGMAVFGLRAGHSAANDWVMVADFAGPANDSMLATAVRELVTVELDQSNAFTTMPRKQVAEALQAAGLPDSARITPKLATELADRSSVRAVVTGSILPVAGTGYSVTLRATSVDDGKQIASAAGSATSENLVSTVGSMARQLRRELGERRDAIVAKRPLQQVTTPSFPAYRRYVLGLDRIYAGDFAGGNRLLHEAIGIDSAFASAWAALGTSHVFNRNLDSARVAFSKALSFRDRLTETQRFRVEADAAYALRHDLPAAISWYDLYLAQNPRSMAALNNRGLFLSSLGRHEEALGDFRQAVAVNPFGPRHTEIEHLNEAAELVMLGRVPEATAVARELEGPFADYFAVLRPVATSDWATAESTAARVAADEATPKFLRIQAVTTQAAAAAALGAVAEADQLLRVAAEKSSAEEMRWYVQGLLLLALARERKPGAAPSPLAKDSSTAGRVMQALWTAAQGDTSRSATDLKRARARPEELERVGAGPRLARGLIDRRAGRWRAVLDSLGPVALHGEHDATLLDRISSYPVRWVVADAYDHVRRDSAIAYLKLLLEPTRMAPGHLALRGLVYPFAQRRLALLIQAQTNDRRP